MSDFIREIWHYFPRRMPVLLFIASVSALSEGLALLMLYPFLSMLITGTLGQGHALGLIKTTVTLIGLRPSTLTFTVLIILTAFLQYAIRIFQSWLSADMQGRYLARMRQELAEAYLQARWSFFLNAKSGELANALIVETSRCLMAFNIFVVVFAASTASIILIGVAFFISFKATLTLLLFAGVFGIAGGRFFRRGLGVGRKLSTLNGVFAGWTSDVLTNIKFFKATASEQVALAKFWEIALELARPTRISTFSPQLLRAIFEFSATVMFVAFMVFGVEKLHMDFLRIVVILGIFLRLLPRLAQLQESMQGISGYLPAASKVRGLRAQAFAAAEHFGSTAPPALRSGPVAISMRGLSVAYGAQKALDDVDVEIPAGSFIAIVGASGAGKTTLIDCLLGLVEMQAGEITADEMKLNAIGLERWRNSIAFQPQDPVMLNGTIRENIVWAEKNVSDERLAEAARKAGILRFIEELPAKFDADVGERGARLSGGQRQRVGLARAMLSQRRLLILDEATSALDAATEKPVLNNIVQLAGEMTIIMITHRLATVQQADRIYVLDHGKVVESGSWAELMRRPGAFRELWNHQLEEAPEK